MCWWNFDKYSLTDCLESQMRGFWGLYFAKEMCWWVWWNFDIPCTECLLWTVGGQWEGSNKYRSCTSPRNSADWFDGILIFGIIVWWLSVCQSGVRRFKYKYSFCALPRKSDDGFDGILILRTVWSMSGVTHQRPQTPTIQSSREIRSPSRDRSGSQNMNGKINWQISPLCGNCTVLLSLQAFHLALQFITGC